jgi:glucose/arabinose dehydrogenase
MRILAPALAAGLLVLPAHTVSADLTYADFSSTAGLNLVGSAARAAGNRLRLTPSLTARVGAAWYTTPQSVAAGFSTTFTFSISSPSAGGADGFAFVVQRAGTATAGGDGCRIGYDGIPASLAVEFDTYLSGTCAAGTVSDPSDNHVSVHTRGALPNSAMESASIGLSSAIPDLSDGAVHTVRIDYTPGVLFVFVDDLQTPRVAAPLDLATTLPLDQGRAWVGFTAATGGAAQNHDIRSWSLTEGPPPGDGRPRTPLITEPRFDGRVVSAQDVHMETASYYDTAGRPHLCTDWEIWTVLPAELVWRAACMTGVERLHVHLGDGQFLGTHAGRHDLLPDRDYRLQARHRADDSNPDTQWSPWGQRSFRTAPPASLLPMLLADVAGAADWRTDTGAPVTLPGAGPAAAAIAVESAQGALLLSITGGGAGNIQSNPPPLPSPVQVRLRLEGGAAGLDLPPTRLVFRDDRCNARSIYLPPVSLAPAARALFWVSTAGSTYAAAEGQDHADLTTLARATESPYLPAQDGYVVEKFATGLQLPVNIAFVRSPGPLPTDVFCYVTELYGAIKMITRDGTVSDFATGLLNFDPTGDFPGSGEQGLAGVAVDPLNGDLYATLLADDGTGAHFPRVIRLRSTDGGRTASEISLVLNMPNDPQGQSHQISNISFGPDGMLYVHMGDGFVASTAQDLSRFRGKILRMTRAGAPAPDNPFYNSADGITARDYVFEYGVRNPFGGAWRYSDGVHCMVENGPTRDRLHPLVAGRNAGWDGSDASMSLFASYVWDPAHAPVNIDFVQAAVFGGSGFPPEKLDHAFVTESGPTYADGPQPLGKRIVEFVIDPSGAVLSGPTTLVEYAGNGRGSAVGLAAGPDGLYFTDLYKDLDALTPIDRGANLWRVRYAPRAPCCATDADGDGAATPADVAIFVGLWTASLQSGTSAGDFDGNGAVQPADVAAFVNAWFAALAAGC